MWPKLVFDWGIRLISGWIPLGNKPISEWLGKVVWVLGIILAFNFVSDLLKQKPSNHNAPSVVALPFSRVGNIDQASHQKSEAPKKKWWQPVPYISVGGGVFMGVDGDSSAGAKAETGLRWDF